MAKPNIFGNFEGQVNASRDAFYGHPDRETPFRLLILGDFSGRKNRALSGPLAGRSPTMIDRDNFDTVLAQTAPELQLFFVGEDSPPITITFKELEDFHPDRLLERLDVFRALRQALKDLNDPEALDSVAAKLGQWTEAEVSVVSAEEEGETGPGSDREIGNTDNLLDMILDESQPAPIRKKPAERSSSWDDFLHRLVQPHLVPDADPRQAELQISVEAAISDVMRKILHNPDFQELEANWRALFWLVSGLETDDFLKIYIVDVAQSELAADLLTDEDLTSSKTYRMLVEQTVETPGANPWSVVAGSFFFGPHIEDIQTLGRMAKIAYHAGAPFFSAADEILLGCKSLADTPDPSDWTLGFDADTKTAWEALRDLDEASALGLLLPRFLLRLPYGEVTDPTECFDFEEMEGEPIHDHYLWGNPVFAAAYLLGKTFSRQGWDFSSGPVLELPGLPLHIYKTAGESRVKPCAEYLIPERTAHVILERGFIPLLSYKNQDLVRLGRFQSISDPPTRLVGPWESVP
ncbi:MAG: type VI secretion system contractile sheath domain-containing protein [Thermodesulfobacteriota bacterium]